MINCYRLCERNDLVVFFFKQKTAYEMRISDWSSDVCSSDLALIDCSHGMPRRVRAWTVSRPPGNTPAVSFFGGSQNSEAGAGQGRGLSCLIIPCRTSEGVLHRAANIILPVNPFPHPRERT